MTAPTLPGPLRGEVWAVDLSPTVGHEQARMRPCIVVSTDLFNLGPADLVMVVPVTGTNRRNPLHVPVSPPEGGLTKQSYVLCDQIRTVSKRRLVSRGGAVIPETMAAIESNLRIVLDL
jgi:mRNA interferase MazF